MRWGKGNVKIFFFAYNFFANNFSTKKARGIIRSPSRSSHPGASKHMHGNFEWSQQYSTPGQDHVTLHVDPKSSCCKSIDASQQIKHNETKSMSPALFNR